MDFNVERKEQINSRKYVKDDVDIAYSFSKKAYVEFGTFIKAIVLFGSSAKNEQKGNNESDIDLLLVVDDVTILLTPEITETYKIILERMVSEISQRIHITTLRFTSFWDSIRTGDPVAINILREGMPIIDSGFFEPMQRLLQQGRIRPTSESIWTYFSRAPTTLHNSKWHLLQASVDLYWATIDAAHAALMKLGEMPPSPEHIADLMQVRMVNEGLIDKKYAKTMKDLYDLYKGIAHRKVKEISGAEYDRLYKQAEEFIKEMQKIIER
jgi:predicted nucleotidyltransferase/uncharacterized protein (UPF0332 family)